MGKPKFENRFTALQQETINRLAEIEQQDADICASCGGEDCVCCEIYHDRQRWVSPEELFEQDDDNFYYNDADYGEEEDDEEDY